MSKINTSDATTLTNETSFLSLYNANNALIETASDNFLSLDGTSPNSMAASLDMNSNRILNLPSPVASEEPLRLQDLTDFLAGNLTIAAAPLSASYVTLATNSTLTSERVLTAGSGITLTDGGAGSTITVSLTTPITTSANLAAALSDETGTGVVVFGTSPTLTTPTITNPTVTTGTFTTPAINTPTITSPTVSGTVAGSATYTAPVLTSATVTTKISPTTDDGAPLGDTTHNFSDVFLASGAVVNFNAGDITLTHSTDHLRFAGAANGYSFDAAAIKSTTTTPVTIASLTPAFQCLGTTAGTTIGFLSGRWSADANGPFYYMYKSRNATINSHTIVQSGDTLGSIWWAGDNGTNESFAANIRCDVDGTPGVGDMPGKIVFATSSDGSGSPTDRASIDSTGAWSQTGATTILSGTAVPAGGTAGSGYKLSSTSNLGLFFGSGAPTLSAAQGSLYIRTDGSSTSTRLYVNTTGSTTWTNVTTAA